MEILVNIMLVVAPVVGLLATLLLLLFVGLKVADICGIDRSAVPVKKIVQILLVVTLAGSVYKVFTSPITRPTTEVHDKQVEMIKYKQNRHDEIVAPVIVDKSFKAEDVDTETLEFNDEILNHANEKISN